MSRLLPHESNPTNNPNHPAIRCVDGTGTFGEWTTAYDEGVVAPFVVFDILNQENIQPTFDSREEAEEYMASLGGAYAPPPLLPFTVVGTWPDAGDFVEHYMAASPVEAAGFANIDQATGVPLEGVYVIAVFAGHLMDLRS